MAQQQIDFPQDFQHTSLKARSYTPSLDLGCHNVQGINVWANTAPRGWGSSSKDQIMPRVVLLMLCYFRNWRHSNSRCCRDSRPWNLWGR